MTRYPHGVTTTAFGGNRYGLVTDALSAFSQAERRVWDSNPR